MRVHQARYSRFVAPLDTVSYYITSGSVCPVVIFPLFTYTSAVVTAQQLWAGPPGPLNRFKTTDALVITGLRPNELGFGMELAKAVASFRVVGTPAVRPVRKAKGLSETAWLQ